MGTIRDAGAPYWVGQSVLPLLNLGSSGETGQRYTSRKQRDRHPGGCTVDLLMFCLVWGQGVLLYSPD